MEDIYLILEWGVTYLIFSAHGDFLIFNVFQRTESKSMQATCQAFAAVFYLTMGDAESSKVWNRGGANGLAWIPERLYVYEHFCVLRIILLVFNVFR